MSCYLHTNHLDCLPRQNVGNALENGFNRRGIVVLGRLFAKIATLHFSCDTTQKRKNALIYVPFRMNKQGRRSSLFLPPSSKQIT